jgi:hypothetical protein
MPSHIDKTLRHTILQEIGQGLRACLREEELPSRLRLQLDRLSQLDRQSPPTTRDHPRRKQTAVRTLVSRMRWRKRR